MLISSQKNPNQPNLQGFKSSSTRIPGAANSVHDSLVKSVGLDIINLLLGTFKILQDNYHRLLKVKIELTSIKNLIKKNQPTILKTALTGVGTTGLIALGYKSSIQGSQIELLSNIPKLASGICLLPVIYGLSSLVLKRKDKKNSSLSALPVGLLATIGCFSDERTTSSFNVAVKLSREKFIKRKNALAKQSINKIKESEECNKAFGAIFSHEHLSPSIKLDSIKAPLNSEVENFEIAQAQIDFTDILVANLEEQFPEDEALKEIRASIFSIKERLVSECEALDLPQEAHKINKAIIHYLKPTELKNIVESLDLSATALREKLAWIGGLSNIDILNLDFRMLTADSIISFVEGIRKVYIAEAQIHFADTLVAELEGQFPDDVTLNAIKASISDIKNEHKNPVKKAGEINEAIIDYLNSENSVKNRVTSLDFCRGNLKALLPCIGAFSNLETLNLSDNILTVLPESIGAFSKLKTLKLGKNKLTFLPESIGGLKQLRFLHLNNNQLTVLPEAIGELIELKLINLNTNKLTFLPEAIGSLTKLKYLTLSNNQLAALPETIGGLENLDNLYLSNNQLAALPEAIGSLTKLEDLTLNNNQLAALPEAIAGLINLDYLCLRNNQLTALPEAIGNLTKLKYLYLSNNQLASLPEAIGSLTKLEYLALNNNQLASLPEAIAGLINLDYLYLSNNQLTALPEAIGNLTKLKYLYLNNNQLTVLPKVIGGLANLEYIYISHNPIPNVHKVLKNLGFKD